MASSKNQGRAHRLVIHLEGGGSQQFWRTEDGRGNVVWSQTAPRPGEKASGDGITTAELVKVVEAALKERRRTGRGLKFRL